jgi:hypothetical protein
MIKLKGYSASEELFRDLKMIGDLVYYEGSLLSLFSNEKGELYLYDWSDSDDKYNRWLVFRVTLPQLLHYLNGNLSHYELITTEHTDSIYSVDLDNELNYHNILRLTVDEIPAEYLPKKHVMHDDNESPDIERIKQFVKEMQDKAYEARENKWKNKFPNLLVKPVLALQTKITGREELMAA